MQQVRESLSALMDNEGDEFDLRRILKSEGLTASDSDTWRRYHLARSAMRREQDVWVDVDISAGVMAAIAEESSSQQASTEELASDTASGSVVSLNSKRRSSSFMSGAAVAAAVSVMVITGVQVFNGNFSGDSQTPELASTPSNSGDMTGFSTPQLAGARVEPASFRTDAVPASMQSPASAGMPYGSMMLPQNSGGFVTVGESFITPDLTESQTNSYAQPATQQFDTNESQASAYNGEQNILLSSPGHYASQLHRVASQ